MNALESVVRRVRETEYQVTQLRITASSVLIAKMVEEFRARGETEDSDGDAFMFGPYLTVQLNDQLPPGTFKIVVQK
jgi:hypothetical protein